MQHFILITHIPLQGLIPQLKTPTLCLKNPHLASSPTSKTCTLSQDPTLIPRPHFRTLHPRFSDTMPHLKALYPASRFHILSQNSTSPFKIPSPHLPSKLHILAQTPIPYLKILNLKTPNPISRSHISSHALPQNTTRPQTASKPQTISQDPKSISRLHT